MQEVEKDTTRPSRSLGDYFGIYLRGIAMGASDIVPGVSGGTMAFILGIYEELIDSIRTLGQKSFIQAAIKLRLKTLFQLLNWQFLLAIALGIFTAIVTLSSGLEWMLINRPIFLWSFFFGLVLASVFVVSKRIKQWVPRLIVALASGAVAAFILVGLVPLQTPEAWWFLLLSGAIASCALILPGVSGAFLLVLLGKYQFALSAVNGLRSGDISNLPTLIFISLGAGLGLISFAQILGWFFKHYHDLTVAVLIGLMIGSLRKIWPWKEELDWLRDATGAFVLDSAGHRRVIAEGLRLPDLANNLPEFLIALLLALVGIGVILTIDRYAGEKKKA
jgi:putative membrane protein